MRHATRGLIAALLLVTSTVSAQPDAGVEARVARLLADLSLNQKLGQMNLRGRSSRGSASSELKAQIRAGQIGALLNIMDRDQVRRLQTIAVEESPGGIPLLFGRDVIHGFRTVFPIPLGQAATFDPALVEGAARVAAEEASSQGVNWTFAPMVDISRDPRWGRIAESLGEDPHLASLLAVAMVRGFQGDLGEPTHLAATVKHFAAYGAAEGGRDYNSTYVPENLLRNLYLRPFHAAVDAGALSLMTGFNDLNGVPATAHRWLLTNVLRDEWGFRGLVVSDWNSVTEMIPHGYSEDLAHAARQAAHAGLDMEMMSTAYAQHLADAVATGEVPAEVIDTAAGNVIRVKLALGLFDDPHRDGAQGELLSKPALDLAREAAVQSLVLLKNEEVAGTPVLPLSGQGLDLAVIGPLADRPHEQLGTWAFDGQAADARTPLDALTERLGQTHVHYAAGLQHSRDRSGAGHAEAVQAAQRSDLILFFGGEEAILSGEAHSRADIRLPGSQQALIGELARSGKPLVLVIMAGRPIQLDEIIDQVDAVIMAWHPGTMGGPALAEVLLGDRSPQGRLPVTWPRSVGQVPIYYNHKRTGRPAGPDSFVHIDDIPVGAWQSSLGNTSHYLDAGYTPHFPFGFGLSYTRFEYSDLRLVDAQISPTGRLEVAATIRNVGSREGTETVQVYVHDRVGSITRPVRELIEFRKVALAPGESRQVRFSIPAQRLAFFGADGNRAVESGQFRLWLAPDAQSGLSVDFEVTTRARQIGYIERLDAGLDRVLDSQQPIEVLADGFDWSEGPVWHGQGQQLLFSDVPQNVIYRWSDEEGLSRWLEPSGCTGDCRGEGSNGLLLDVQGRMILAQHGDRRIARLDSPLHHPRPRFTTLADRYQGRRFNSPNDAVFDRAGNLYFTDPPYGLPLGSADPARELPYQGVYRLTDAGQLTLLTDSMTRPNGIALSRDERTLLVANSDPDHAVWMAWNLAGAGELGEGRVWFDATHWVDDRPGLPDGMKVDAAGHVYATGPGGVLVFSPEGQHLGTIRIPSPAANCAIGDDGASLYITADQYLLRVGLKPRVGNPS